jgi:hypothetical protein
VADLIGEPEARFQAVRDRGDWVCGELNTGARQAGTPGYRRFVFDATANLVAVDPMWRAAGRDLAPGHACAKRFAEQTVEERMTCGAAPDLQKEQQLQADFEALWAARCR